MHTISGRTWLSQKQNSYGRVCFGTSTSCYEMHNTGYSNVKLFYWWIIIACSHTATAAIFRLSLYWQEMLHCVYNIKVFTCHHLHVLLLNHTGNTKVMEIKQSSSPLKRSVPLKEVYCHKYEKFDMRILIILYHFY